MTAADTSWLQRMRFGGGVFKTLGIGPTAKQYRLADDTVGGAHVLINIILLQTHTFICIYIYEPACSIVPHLRCRRRSAYT